MKFWIFAFILSFVFAPLRLNATMNGGDFEIYADSFSMVQDQLTTSGGTFTLVNTGGETSAGVMGKTATGTLFVNLDTLSLLSGETFTLNDGAKSTVFEFRNLAGFSNGVILDGHVIIDTGGGGGMDTNTMRDRFAEAINGTNANIGIQARNNGVNAVTLVNTRTTRSDGNVAILESVAHVDFLVAGMSGGGEATTGFELRGGFQAMERSSLTMSVNSNTVSLGELSLVAVASGSVVLSVTTDSTTGYTASVTEDGNLRKGGGGDNDDINDVLDGSVTAGSEEYGITTSGGGGLIGADTAISGTVSVAAASGEVSSQQTTVTFKAAIANTSRAGSYSQVVNFSATANP